MHQNCSAHWGWLFVVVVCWFDLILHLSSNKKKFPLKQYSSLSLLFGIGDWPDIGLKVEKAFSGTDPGQINPFSAQRIALHPHNEHHSTVRVQHCQCIPPVPLTVLSQLCSEPQLKLQLQLALQVQLCGICTGVSRVWSFCRYKQQLVTVPLKMQTSYLSDMHPIPNSENTTYTFLIPPFKKFILSYFVLITR